MNMLLSKRPLWILFLVCAGFGCGSADKGNKEESLSRKGPYADLGDVTLYFEVHGAGDPILLLHGGFASAESWKYQIPVLAEQYRVIAVDSRGHGRSTDAEGPITYQSLASDAVNLLDHLGIERAHVVGWSDGGVTGLQMGILYPDRLDKLVTIGATAQGSGSLTERWDFLFTNRFLFDFAMDLLFLPEYERLSPDPEHWPVFEDKMFSLWSEECYFSPGEGEPCMTPLEDITHEVLLIAGTREMVRREHTEALHQHIPNSEVLILPRGTHFVLWEQPEAVNEAILEFLRDDPVVERRRTVKRHR